MKRSVVTFAAIVLAGCGSPSVVYEKLDVDRADPKAPPVGSITFALYTSDITLSPSGTASKTESAPTDTGTNQGGSGGTGAGNHTKTSLGGSQGQNNGNTGTGTTTGTSQTQAAQTTLQVKNVCAGSTFTDQSKSTDWMRCFGIDPSAENALSASTVAVQVTPSSDQDRVYMAVPHNDWLNLHTTEFTGAPLSNNDELLLKKVTVKYSDHTKDVVAAVGTGVTAGAPFGPAGMAVGGLAAFFGKVEGLGFTKVSEQDPNKYICQPPPGSASVSIATPKTSQTALWLPATVSLNDTLVLHGQDKTTPDGAQCWHLLPKMAGNFEVKQSIVDQAVDPDAETPYSGYGWLYRIRLDKKTAINSQAPDDYFGAAPDVKTSFPYSTCRKAHFDIVWWEALKKEKYQYLSMPIMVADPTHIGVAGLPVAGDISLHTLCGATVTSAASDNPSLDQTVNAVLATVKTIKDTQSGGGTAAGSGKSSSSLKN